MARGKWLIPSALHRSFARDGGAVVVDVGLFSSAKQMGTAFLVAGVDGGKVARGGAQIVGEKLHILFFARDDGGTGEAVAIG